MSPYSRINNYKINRSFDLWFHPSDITRAILINKKNISLGYTIVRKTSFKYAKLGWEIDEENMWRVSTTTLRAKKLFSIEDLISLCLH